MKPGGVYVGLRCIGTETNERELDEGPKNRRGGELRPEDGPAPICQVSSSAKCANHFSGAKVKFSLSQFSRCL